MNKPHSNVDLNDPVTTCIPGEVPDNAKVGKGNITIGCVPASTYLAKTSFVVHWSTVAAAFKAPSPKDPRTGEPVVNTTNPETLATRAMNESTAQEDEMTQISTSAGDTLGGATSKDLYRGMGKPVQGQSSLESHHNGRPGRKRESEGTTQFGPHGGSLYSKGCWGITGGWSAKAIIIQTLLFNLCQSSMHYITCDAV